MFVLMDWERSLEAEAIKEHSSETVMITEIGALKCWNLNAEYADNNNINDLINIPEPVFKSDYRYTL